MQIFLMRCNFLAKSNEALFFGSSRMLGRSNLFSNIPCPFFQNGQCQRPFCHYKHEVAQLIPEEPTAVQEYIPSYSTTPTLHFQGYQGFFQGTNNYADESSTAFGENCYVEQLPTNSSTFGDQMPIPSYSSTASSTVVASTQQESTNINELAKNLAAINNAIRELQDKLTAHKSQFGDLTDAPYEPEETTTEPDDVPQTVSNHVRSKSTNFKSYRPTPIEELEKMNGSKKRSNSSAAASVNGTHSKKDRSTMKKSTKPEPDCELGALVDDLVGSNVDEKNSEKVFNGKKIKSKKRKSVSTFDLFGDSLSTDEDENVKKMEPKQDRASKSKTIKTERKSVQFKSSSDCQISPPVMKKPKIEISVIKSDQTKKVQIELSPDIFVPQAPKRLAHANLDAKNTTLLRQAGGERSRPSANYRTPKEQLQMRFAQMQKQKEELLKQKSNKKDVSTSSGDEKYQPTDSTIAGTIRKGEKRVAHTPLKSTLKRPTIDVDIGSKVPTAVRQRYLNLFVDECMKFAKTEEDAFKTALEQEKTVFNKSASKAAYLNSVVNAIKRLRDDKGLKSAFDGFTDGQATSSASAVNQFVSHDFVLGGRQAAKCSFTVKKSTGQSVEIKGQDFYDRLLEFVLTPAQLEENGYPRCDPQVKGRAVYKKDSTVKLYVDDENTKRSCCRCGLMFQISAEGEVSNGDCIYHWGRPWKKKVAGVVESRYNCCQGDFNSKGCCVAKAHVTDTMPKSFLDNYYQTQTSYGFEASVFSLDCEMVYTTGGTELARVTVVNEDLDVVYEKVVKPSYKVLDYNTRFSGLTETDVSMSKVTLADVHEDLSKMFCAETILMGHSLESDLRALRIIHDRVVDTSVVFPHRLGGTFKRALRTLMLEYLQKIIQDDLEGHDSKEDACACMQLMKWKIKNDCKK